MDVTEDHYLQMIRGKTAALIAAAAGLGGRVTSDDEDQIAALVQFGEALGLAFQMQDDLLDIWGDPGITGKPFATDLRQRKMSLPVIYAFTHTSDAEREQLTDLYGQRESLSDADVHVLLDILDHIGARAYVERLAQAEYNRAMATLDRIRPVDRRALDDLCSLAHSLLGRIR